MDAPHCKTEPGTLEDLAASAIVYGLVRRVMPGAGRRQGRPAGRIRFIDALRRLSSSPAGQSLPDLIVNPLRPDRIEPRCQKR